MEVLATKIAELLDVTIEQAVLLYPILRQQFIWYNVFRVLKWAVIIPMLISAFIAFYYAKEYAKSVNNMKCKIYPNEDDKRRVEVKNSIMKKHTWITSGIICVWIAINTIVYLVAPDLMIIMKFLK